MSPQPAGDTARLFFALWPSDATRDALARYADEWEWPEAAARVPAQNFHVTLHFLGNVSRSRLPDLRRLRLDFAPFKLHFGYSEVWPHGIAVLRPHAPPAALGQLQRDLARAICDLGLIAERRDYRPHLTLARRAAHAVAPRLRAEIEWPVERFVLVDSRPDSRPAYVVLADYPAQGSGESTEPL